MTHVELGQPAAELVTGGGGNLMNIATMKTKLHTNRTVIHVNVNACAAVYCVNASYSLLKPCGISHTLSPELLCEVKGQEQATRS